MSNDVKYTVDTELVSDWNEEAGRLIRNRKINDASVKFWSEIINGQKHTWSLSFDFKRPFGCSTNEKVTTTKSGVKHEFTVSLPFGPLNPGESPRLLLHELIHVILGVARVSPKFEAGSAVARGYQQIAIVGKQDKERNAVKAKLGSLIALRYSYQGNRFDLRAIEAEEELLVQKIMEEKYVSDLELKAAGLKPSNSEIAEKYSAIFAAVASGDPDGDFIFGGRVPRLGSKSETQSAADIKAKVIRDELKDFILPLYNKIPAIVPPPPAPNAAPEIEPAPGKTEGLGSSQRRVQPRNAGRLRDPHRNAVPELPPEQPPAVKRSIFGSLFDTVASVFRSSGATPRETTGLGGHITSPLASNRIKPLAPSGLNIGNIQALAMNPALLQQRWPTLSPAQRNMLYSSPAYQAIHGIPNHQLHSTHNIGGKIGSMHHLGGQHGSTHVIGGMVGLKHGLNAASRPHAKIKSGHAFPSHGTAFMTAHVQQGFNPHKAAGVHHTPTNHPSASPSISRGPMLGVQALQKQPIDLGMLPAVKVNGHLPVHHVKHSNHISAVNSPAGPSRPVCPSGSQPGIWTGSNGRSSPVCVNGPNITFTKWSK